MTRHSGKTKQYLCKTSITQPKRLLTKYNLECNIRNYAENNGIKYIIDVKAIYALTILSDIGGMKDKYYIFSLPLLVPLNGINTMPIHVNPAITEAAIRVGLRPHLENIKNYYYPFQSIASFSIS